MAGFWREHATSLVGSVLLHGVLIGAALLLTLWSAAPKIVAPATIQAYLAPAPTRKVAVAERSAPVTVESETPAPVPPAAVTPPTPKVAEPKAPAKAPVKPPEKAPLKAGEKPPEKVLEKAPSVAKPTAKPSPAVDPTLALKRAKAEREKAAEQEASRVADEARREASRQQAEAIARKAEAEANARQRSQREADLARALAGEQRNATENAGLLNRYIAEIQARVERAWNRPPSAQPGLKCEVFVTQVPGGTVTQVRIGQCNGDSAVQQSISVAVFRASPLPAPPDPSLFERNLKLVFAPDA